MTDFPNKNNTAPIKILVFFFADFDKLALKHTYIYVCIYFHTFMEIQGTEEPKLFKQIRMDCRKDTT